MQIDTNPSKSIPIKYGLISGLVIIGYSVATLWGFGDFTKLSQQEFKLFELLGNLRYIILIITVYLVIRQTKKLPDEIHTFKSLLKGGVKVALIIALMVGLMETVYIYFNPDFYEEYGKLYLRQMKTSGAGEAEIQMAKEQMEKYSMMKTPLANGLFYLFETAFIGNIASLVFAMVMRPRT